MQIIVLGAHRSGTSLVTRLINMMGAYFASEQASIGFNDENPKGFWERKDVIACNDSLLSSWGCNWSNLAQLPAQLETTAEQQYTIKNIILEMDAHRPWVMKDPRLCVTFPAWRPHLEIPVCVVVYRDPLEIARSLQLRNGFSLQHGLALWEAYTLAAVNAAQGLPTLFMHHADVLTDPVAATRSLYDGLVNYKIQGLRLPSDEEILAFVEPKFYRSRFDTAAYGQFLNQQQLALFSYTKGEGGGLPASISAGAHEAMRYADEIEGLKEQHQLEMVQVKDHLSHQREQLSRQVEQLLHEETLLLQEKAALLQENSRIAGLEEKKAQLEALVTECMAIRNSHRWQIGNSCVTALNVLRLHAIGPDVFTEVAARLEAIRKG